MSLFITPPMSGASLRAACARAAKRACVLCEGIARPPTSRATRPTRVPPSTSPRGRG